MSASTGPTKKSCQVLSHWPVRPRTLSGPVWLIYASEPPLLSVDADNLASP